MARIDLIRQRTLARLSPVVLAALGLAGAWVAPATALATAAADTSQMASAGAGSRALAAGLEATVDGAEWLSRRRQFSYRDVPYGFTSLPMVYFSSVSGWNYGARVNLSQYTRRPFRYRLSASWVQSTRQRVDAFVRLRVPSLWGTAWGLRLQADVSEGQRSYYGQGNDSRVERRYTRPGSPLYRDADYYSFRIHKPRLFLLLERDLYHRVFAGAGFGLKHVSIDDPAGASLLFEERPPGIDGGAIGLLGAAVRWDTRDDETIPRRGTLHEWSYETSHNSLRGLLLPTVGYSRYTVSDLRYRPLGRRLDLANRVVFEVMQGRVPVDVYGDLGGLRRKVRGLGGDETLRGYDTSRFIDDVRFFSNTELRWKLHVHRALRQYLEWTGVGFVDAGRVWPDLASLTPRGTRFTAGVGLRIYWNEDLVLGFEYRQSAEQGVVDSNLGNIF